MQALYQLSYVPKAFMHPMHTGVNRRTSNAKVNIALKLGLSAQIGSIYLSTLIQSPSGTESKWDIYL
jgi:hypothetical protein